MANKLVRAAYTSTHSSGVVAVTVLHYVSRPGIGVEDPGSISAIRDALHGALTTPYRSVISAQWTVNTLVVSEVLAPDSTDVPDQASQTINSVGSLTTTGDQLAPAQAVLLTWYSNAAIRSGHGRSFMPSPGNASFLASSGQWDMTATLFTTTYPAFVNAAKSNISVDVGTSPDATASLVIYSRTRHAQDLPAYYFDVSTGTVRAQPHWLRSRMTAP